MNDQALTSYTNDKIEAAVSRYTRDIAEGEIIYEETL
jgi:hypothetical protein